MSPTVVRVGARPGRLESFADFFDGERPITHRVHLSIDDETDALVISQPEGPTDRWPLDSLREIADQAAPKGFVLTSTEAPMARLFLLDGETCRVIEARVPGVHRRPGAPNRRKLAGWSVAAFASVALIIFGLVPLLADQLARYLPPEGEAQLGEATLEQIRTSLNFQGDPIEICETPAGRRALDAMTERLTAGLELDYELKVFVLDSPLINAFTLPGGYIVLFEGLLSNANGPDEVAAVFAHELGHVVNRDPTRIALRSAGSIGILGLVLGDFAGGAVVLFLVNQMIQADYTQEAEVAADDFAAERLRAARIDRDALASFFERLREEYGETPGIVQHFASHPALSDRIEAARQADGAAVTAPALSPQDWRALRGICR